MLDEAIIAKAIGLLQKAAPGAKVILFGSYARGNANDKSDVDLLVVEPQLGWRRGEMTRLKRVLKPLGVPADVIVVSQKTYDSWTPVYQGVSDLPAQSNRSFSFVKFVRRIWTMFGNAPSTPAPSADS
jgi:predicted nucleotidyltransferase